MASYKSQYPPQRRAEDRIPTTRLPQRSITPTASTGQSLVSSQSKLQKRRPSRDEQVYPSRSLTGHKEAVRTVSSRHEGSGRTAPLETQRSRNMSSRPAPPDSKSYLPKLEVPANTRTPSLASGSSASTIESPRSNVLRRKQTTVGVASNRQPSRTKDESMSYQDDRPLMGGIPGGYKDPFSETVLGISLPSSSSILAHSDPQLDIYGNGLYDCEIGPTDILPIPTPQYALSATPSTRYSESPGAFSISSTATSMTSYSPKAKPSLRTRQTSPLQTRPPVTRHKTPDESAIRQPHSLSTVRESSTSSSSASTVVADGAKYKGRQSPHQLASLPQSPPAPQATRRQAPPEFAHLADRSPAQLPMPKRPSRPSRDGTPEISGLRGPSPIIQSNMMNMPVSHRRTSSNESKNMPLSSSRTKMAAPAKPVSRLPSPSPAAIARPPTRGTTPDLQKERDGRRSSTLPMPPAPAPSPSKTSRFGFFARRTKTDPIPSAKSDNKLQRKGPAAGTGHEGYGRYAVRGRSGSSISANSIGRSASAGTTRESLEQTPSTRKSSVTSTTSSDMDDFYANRLAPVIIRGAGSSSELSRSPEPMNSSSTLDLSSRSGAVLKNTTNNTSQTSLAGTKPTLLPSAMPDTIRGGSPMKKITLGRRRPSESDDDTKRSFLPSLTSRRVSRTLQTAQGATPEPQSKPANKSKTEKDSAKPSKRWNFFQRAHAAPREATPAAPALSAAKKLPTSRSVAHYALMDQSGLNMNDIEQLMKEARDDGNESALSDDDADKKERMQSMLLPPKPIIPPNHTLPARSASPKVFLRSEAGHGPTATQQSREEPQQAQQPQKQHHLIVKTDLLSAATAEAGYQSQGDLTPVTDLSPPSSPLMSTPHIRPTNVAPVMPATTPAPPPAPIVQETITQPQSLPPQGPPPTGPPPRPSRLAQVGRIPQVVSSRNQPRRPSSQSFSRPFAADQPRPSASPPTSFDAISPVTATVNAKETYPILHGLSALSHGSAIATMSPLSDESRRSEFFKFPPRKDSEVSYSSGSGIWSFAPVTAPAAAPMSAYPFSEDELWNEYDDLLDEVLSEEGGSHSQHASLEVQPLKPSKAAQASALLGCPPPEVANPSIHLRRSRLLAVLHSTQSPTSDISFSEFISGYGERKISVIDPVTGRLSLPSSPRQSVGSTKRSTRSSLPASLSASARQSKATIASRSSKDRDSASTNRYRDTRLMEIAETQADGLLSMANLRFGALMTSKWLSFGRVLFSPIHFDLKDPSEDRVLVIDGLGKDWSYYCALTYPEATVYNIGPEPSSANQSATGSSEPWSTLRNHRHICHQSLSNALPFPMSFFASVVLRFPSALPSSVHRFVLSEVKRVLRPGGYLEFSVLDMDLVNMGNRARRAVRGLKVKMQAADEDTSLRNISDEIMAGIGRKGFVECNRCVVGVPVAGQLPNLEDMKSSAARRKGSTASSSSKTNSTTSKAKKPEVSFSDLLSGSSISESADNGITDMVARVGRWWYSRCYESILLPEADEGAAASGDLLKNSIWRDESLISECEKRGTSFKLLIGYAQKPEIGVRRTVSV